MAAEQLSTSARSQQEAIKALSLWQKVMVVPAMIKVLCLTGLSRLSFRRAGPTWRVHMGMTMLRELFKTVPPGPRHLLLPSDDVVITQVCQKRGVPLEREVLPDGTTGFWIGNKHAGHVIYNLHGGGFSQPINGPAVAHMVKLHKMLKSQGKDVAVLILAYDLTPAAQYPRQNQQAAMMFERLLQLGKAPSNIVLIGDSAGGNMVLALLSHLAHPHPAPSMPRLDLRGDTLRAAILISPWVSFSRDPAVASLTAMIPTDHVHPAAGTMWAEAYLGTRAPEYPNSDNYAQPRDAPPEWWADIPVRDVRVVNGAEEVLIGLIHAWLEPFKKGYRQKLDVVDVAGECHVAHYVYPMWGVKECGMGRTVEAWMGEIFESGQ